MSPYRTAPRPAAPPARRHVILWWLLTTGCMKVGVAIGLLFNSPLWVAWAVGLIGVASLAAFAVLLLRSDRVEIREFGTEPTPEQMGADIYAATQRPISVTVELTPEGRAALMLIATKERMSVPQAFVYAWLVNGKMMTDPEAKAYARAYGKAPEVDRR